MLKQIFKSCLAVTMACSMSTSVFADVKLGGYVRANLQQTTVEDGASTTDFESDARFNLSGNTKMGGWTGSAFLELEFEEDASSITQRDRWINLENDALSFKFGRQYVHGVELVTDYHIGDNIHDIYWAGEYFGARNDFLNISLKDAGVNVWVGMNRMTDSGTYNQTDAGIFYGGSFGSLDLNLMYASVSKAIDVKDGGVKDSAEDGYAGSELAFGLGYGITDAMSVGLNYGTVSDKAGNASDATKVNYMDINLTMALSDTSGIFASAGSKSNKVGSADAVNGSNMLVQYNTKVGGATVYAVYGSNKSEVTEKTTTNMGVGAQYDF